MQKKKVVIIIAGVIVLVIIGVMIRNNRKVETLNAPASAKQPASQKKNTNSPVSPPVNSASVNSAPVKSTDGADADKDGVPDVAEVTLGTDPNNPDTDGDGISDLQDKDPVFAENPIKNNATQEGFKITEALVENNLDPVTKKIADDHLEINLQNISGKDLSDFEIYYTITDPTLNKTEGYYRKLTGFVLKSGEQKAIHFDKTTSDSRFSENPNSIYRTNGNAKTFNIFVSTAGYRIENVQISKDPGGAEKAD